MTFLEARRDILDTFKAYWDAEAPAANGGVLPAVEYDGVGDVGMIDADVAWARVTLRHSAARQASLASADGTRVWERTGIIVVQVFTPLSQGGGLVTSDALAAVAKNAFEGVATAGGVWFRNVRLNEVGVERTWYQVNVVADFEYDERR